MKRLFFLSFLVLSFGIVALAQGTPPITVTEVDGSPKITGVTRITVSNGTLTKSGTRATITTGGGGGSPGGSDTQLQYNNAGAFGGVSGATSDGTNITFGSANLRATLPRFTTGISDSGGNSIIGLSAVGSAVNQINIANATAGNSPTISTVGASTDISLTFSPKGAGSNVFTKNSLFNVGSGALDNLTYVGSTSSGAVNASFGFFVAGVGSQQASDGPYFLGRGNNFSGIANQHGMLYFGAGDPGVANGNDGNILFATGADVVRVIVRRDGYLQLVAFLLSQLGGPPDGSMAYCSDCAVGTDPCTGSSTGAFAYRLNSRWYCP